MTQNNHTHRLAIVALSASLVLPIAPVFGQEAPVVVAPPSPVTVAPPPPVAARPPQIVVTPQPAPRAAPTPAVVTRVAPSEPAPVARAPRGAARPARVAPRARISAPVQAAPAPAATPAPIAEAPPAPPAAAPAPPVAEAAPPVAPAETAPAPRGSTLPWLIAGLAILAGLVAFALYRRRRSRSEADDDYYQEEVVYEAAPVAVEADEYQPAIVAPLPSFRRPETPAAPPIEAAVPESDVEEVNEVATDPADVEVLAAGSQAHGDRPWLEMLMRPIRAGATGDDTVVEFSLTVGNTGGVPAEDVRISAWMLASGGSEMESMLIQPPAGATLSETRIEAGGGATVEATVTLPREAIDGAMLPVVVTDARYTLPGGGEGRTSASFAIGMPIGEELVPFPANPASGLNDGVEARVHGEVEHV